MTRTSTTITGTDSEAATTRQNLRDHWETSPEKIAARNKAYALLTTSMLCGIAGVLPFLDTRSEAQGVIYYIGPAALLVIALISYVAALMTITNARTRLRARIEQEAKGEADQALEQANVNDIHSLMRYNRAQMYEYDTIARTQAETSHRASLNAMRAGLLIVAVGIVAKEARLSASMSTEGSSA